MKITLDDNNIVFTSDLHLNHRKLCTSYEDHFDRTRKYATIDEMNADIEKQWNDVVNDETTVFFLGDFTLGTPGSKLVDLFREYYTKLHFKHMYWLMGNHDHEIFKKLSKVIEEFPKVTLVRDNHILLTHNGKISKVDDCFCHTSDHYRCIFLFFGVTTFKNDRISN